MTSQSSDYAGHGTLYSHPLVPLTVLDPAMVRNLTVQCGSRSGTEELGVVTSCCSGRPEVGQAFRRRVVATVLGVEKITAYQEDDPYTSTPIILTWSADPGGCRMSPAVRKGSSGALVPSWNFVSRNFFCILGELFRHMGELTFPSISYMQNCHSTGPN